MRNIKFLLGVALVFLLALPATQARGQIYRVEEMNTQQIRALDREKTVVLLPGGILEEHGPYLPSFSDSYMNQRLTQEVANAIVARPGWKVLLFPLNPLGTGGANEIGGKYVFSGSYTVRFSTLRAIFIDLATELGEQGFRWIFVISSHMAPNHNRALDQAGDYFRDMYGGHMVNLNGLQPVSGAWEEGAKLMREEEREEDGFAVHAGMIETSINLFLRPDLVSPAYKNAPAQTGRNMDELVQLAKRDNWPGYFGSPRLASAAFGALVWKHQSSQFVEFALKILDGLDERQVPRYGDMMKASPANIAIDKAALEHDQEIERKQLDWLRNKGLK